MKADIHTLQDTFKIGYEAYESSRIEAENIWELFHNRQYTEAQLAVLKARGQPAETFNVIKLFSRMLLGYYSNVVNTIKAMPVQYNDIPTAALINDLIKVIMRQNNFNAEGDKIKLSGLISGLLVGYTEVVKTEEEDEFGRPLFNIRTHHVPENEIVLDPSSKLEDYSDAEYIHRFRWLTEDKVRKQWGQEVVDKLTAYDNHLGFNDTDFNYSYDGQFVGRYRVYNNYLIIHSIIVDDDDKVWSIFWSGDEELERKEITYKEVRFPYRVQRVHTSNRTEYYGIFREVAESQKAVNQAIIKIQLMINTQKAFVEKNAVEDMAEFENAYNRVSGIVSVLDLAGIRVENLSREVLDQYGIIDKAFDRIQRILSINDSFLGMAFASDSGRKVKLQQNATITALRYLTGRIEDFYRLLGWDLANLAKQYYTAHQWFRVADEQVGQRWMELNKPLMTQTPDGQDAVIFEEVLDPASQKPMLDEDGNIIVAPIPTADTEIAFTKIDIEIESVAYNDEDEKNQLMMETVLSGSMGNMLAQVNPAGFFKASALSIRSMKTKYSPDISQILEETANMLGGNQQASTEASMMAGQTPTSSPLSRTQKLPQNTNEPID